MFVYTFLNFKFLLYILSLYKLYKLFCGHNISKINLRLIHVSVWYININRYFIHKIRRDYSAYVQKMILNEPVFPNFSPPDGRGSPPLSLGLATRNNDFELSFASSPNRGWRVTIALCLWSYPKKIVSK